MKLVVGLGNPGKKYENTRHNVGFMAIDAYLGEVSFDSKFNGKYYLTQQDGVKTIFLKPQSYMNLSGIVVKKFVDYFKIDVKNILVIRDDLDISLGKAKIKQNSSSGGDNGIKSIIEELSSQEFTQLKIGISSDNICDKKDFVLSRFIDSELKVLNNTIKKVLPIIDDFQKTSVNEIINKYNGILKWNG